MVRILAVLVLPLMLALMPGIVPCATAGPLPGVYVRTESGRMHCLVASNQVICEPHCPMGPNDTACQPGGQWDGFPQAPLDNMGNHMNGAIVNAAGAFHWSEGDLGAGNPDSILYYGQTYHMQGWTVQAGGDGTRFTNDSTGHGMFVSIENVYSF
jgi:hypothetical protein